MRIQIGKKILGCRNIQKKLENLVDLKRSSSYKIAFKSDTVYALQFGVPMFKVIQVPVLNTLKLHFTTEHRVNYVREHMRIFNSRFKCNLLAFWPFSLNVVHPEMSLFFFTSAGRSTGSV